MTVHPEDIVNDARALTGHIQDLVTRDDAQKWRELMRHVDGNGSWDALDVLSYFAREQGNRAGRFRIISMEGLCEGQQVAVRNNAGWHTAEVRKSKLGGHVPNDPGILVGEWYPQDMRTIVLLKEAPLPALTPSA